MARAAQRDRARREASGGPSRLLLQRPDTGQFGAIQAMAPSLGVEISPIDTDDAGEIERAVIAFASAPNSGLIERLARGRSLQHRELIVALAARHRLPAIYAYRNHVMSGGLMSYGLDNPRPVPPGCRLRGSHPPGRETGRLACSSANQIRACHQPQNSQGARSGNPPKRFLPALMR